MISVVMSAYAWRDEIPVAVDSVLSQTFTDFELVIGTRDQRVWDYLKDKDPRILLLTLPECNLYESLNILFNAVHGEYVTVLHDDDYYLPTFLQTLHDAFDGDPKRYTWVASGFIREDRDGTRVRSVGTHPLATLHHSALYSRYYLNKLKNRDGFVFDPRWELSSDTNFMHRLLSLGPAKHSGQWLYVYRTWTSSYKPLYSRFQNFLEGVEAAKSVGFHWSFSVLLRNFAFTFMQAAHYAGISWKGLGLERARRWVERWDMTYK